MHCATLEGFRFSWRIHFYGLLSNPSHPIPVKSAEITTIADRDQNEAEELGSHHKLNLASN